MDDKQFGDFFKILITSKSSLDENKIKTKGANGRISLAKPLDI